MRTIFASFILALSVLCFDAGANSLSDFTLVSDSGEYEPPWSMGYCKPGQWGYLYLGQDEKGNLVNYLIDAPIDLESGSTHGQIICELTSDVVVYVMPKPMEVKFEGRKGEANGEVRRDSGNSGRKAVSVSTVQ